MNITAVSRDKKDEFKREGFLVNDFCDIRTGLYDLEFKKGVKLIMLDSKYLFSYEGKEIRVKHSDFWNIII